ncbi:hypothetical protein BCIN_12g06270 [Botrytis cinerea B05.10]|uniref:Uncharacterized protein n=2 Tax=Botryotinia fuckeliana TaxID=40559 RepID=A0A384JZU2_BOTFB|nr:hypothetical protein BCIN_12g06270 [Botrytis cinerea B05.10]ATZ56095.1 hypothetical protein BCIN_12g06270 [Botrytis cinerea B05.10]CCD33630.1 hypothetical protein BofuT4_P068460.1 [Botrytis cinerea T4]
MSSSSSTSSSSTSNIQKIKKLFKLKSPSTSRSTSRSTSLPSTSLNSPHPSPTFDSKPRIHSSSTITSITSSHCSHSSYPTSRKGSTSGLSTSGLSTAAAFSLSSSNHTILEDSRNSIDSRNRIAGLGLRGSGIGMTGAQTRCNSLSSMISIGSLEIEKTETFGVEIEERGDADLDLESRKERRRGKVWEGELGEWIY